MDLVVDIHDWKQRIRCVLSQTEGNFYLFQALTNRDAYIVICFVSMHVLCNLQLFACVLYECVRNVCAIIALNKKIDFPNFVCPDLNINILLPADDDNDGILPHLLINCLTVLLTTKEVFLLITLD